MFMLIQNKIKLLLNVLFVVVFPFTVVSQMTKEKTDRLCEESKKTTDFKAEVQKIDSAYAIAKTIHYKEGMLKSRLLKAAWHLNSNSDVKSSLRIIKEIEPDVMGSDNFEQISHLKLIKAMSYVKLSFNEQAEKELTTALSFAEKIKNDDLRHGRKAIVFMSWGAVYNDIHPDQKSKETNQKAFKNFKRAYEELLLIQKPGTADRLSLVNSSNVLGHYYVNIKKADSAQFYLHKSLSTAEQLNDYEGVSYASAQLGALHLMKEEYMPAVKYYEQSTKTAMLSNAAKPLLVENYLALSSAYEKLGDKEKHQKYLKAYQVLSDSLNINYKNGVQQAVETIGHDIHAFHEQDKQGYKMWILLISVITIVLTAASFLIYRRYKSEKLSKEELKRQLDQKMDELNKFSDRLDPEDEEKLKEVVRLAITNDTSFLIRFNELFPKFSEKLLKISPSLKSNDLRICSYMRLNFDTKEIARYGGDTVRSVESKKYRLRKKFNISSSEDINVWISKL